MLLDAPGSAKPNTAVVDMIIEQVRAIASPRWDTRIDDDRCLVFSLRDAMDPVWPATLSVVVGEPGMRFGPAADSFNGAVQIAHSDVGRGYVAASSTAIDGCLYGNPINHAMWIDADPPLHIVGTATGSDLFALADLIDELIGAFGESADQAHELDRSTELDQDDDHANPAADGLPAEPAAETDAVPAVPSATIEADAEFDAIVENEVVLDEAAEAIDREVL